MKDLYARLGISPEASAEEIVAAGQAGPEAGACARVLADAGQRAAYDRAYSTLKSIGILRHRLGLDSGDSWFLNRYPDFAPRFRSAIASGKARGEGAAPSAVQAAQQAPAQNAGSAPGQTKPASQQPAANSTRLVPVLAAVAAIVLVIALVLVLVL